MKPTWGRIGALALAWLAIVVAGCGSSSSQPGDAGVTHDFQHPVDLLPPPPDLAPPLRDAGDHPPPPSVASGGGPVLHHVDLVTVTWSGDPDAQDRADFGSWIVTSNYYDLLAEYGVMRGTARGPFAITTPPPANLDDGEVGALLRGRIAAKELPPPAPETLYVVYLPAGTTSTLDGSHGCEAYGGYHHFTSSFLGGATPWLVYAIIPSCAGGVDSERITVSHEVVEAVTEPREGGWRDPALPYGELGDLCTSLSYFDVAAGYSVTRFWSKQNADAGTLDPCVPVPAPPYVYFNAALDPEESLLSLDDTGKGTVVVQIEPFAMGAVGRIAWRINTFGAPGISFVPSSGSGVPGSTTPVTIKASALAQPGYYPIWISATAKTWNNVWYGSLTVQ